MIADLRRIFYTSGLKQEFDYLVSGTELPKNDSYAFKGDVVVSGCVYNRADVVHLDYSVKFTLSIICDRCLKELDREYSFDFRRIVVKNVNSDNDEFIVAENDRIDLTEIAVSDLLLSLPTKMLCKDDCKGLCPVCGCDLNESDCGCRE
ncbi:MAG: DUF177 domain-containing protein [Clostridium sp.]|nr:DUF177 domain-containing protein [Clostridium sp.]MCM1548006.1 DUF177 domain-containing protein [Ruminococcus sp.]